MDEFAFLRHVFFQVNEDELEVLFSEHVEFLFSLVKQTNNVNIHIRSIAASCLTEIELCFPVSIITVLCFL
jgi:hypothetical protein